MPGKPRVNFGTRPYGAHGDDHEPVTQSVKGLICERNATSFAGALGLATRATGMRICTELGELTFCVP